MAFKVLFFCYFAIRFGLFAGRWVVRQIFVFLVGLSTLEIFSSFDLRVFRVFMTELSLRFCKRDTTGSFDFPGEQEVDFLYSTISTDVELSNFVDLVIIF